MNVALHIRKKGHRYYIYYIYGSIIEIKAHRFRLVTKHLRENSGIYKRELPCISKGSSFKGQRREKYEYGSYGSFRALFTFVTLPMNCVKWLWGQSAVHVPVYAYTYTSSSLISSKLSFGFMNWVQGFLKRNMPVFV